MNYKLKRLLGLLFANSQSMRWLLQAPLFRDSLNQFDLQGKKVLDIGCGGGSYAIELFLKRGAMVCLADYKNSHVVLAKKQVGEAGYLDSDMSSFVQLNAEELPFSESAFDGIFCSEVLEHLKDPSMALKEMHRVTTKDAFACISVPHPPEWISNPEHVTAGFTVDEFTKLAKNTGWKVSDYRFCLFVLSRLIFMLLVKIRLPLPIIPLLALERLIPNCAAKYFIPYDLVILLKKDNTGVFDIS